MRDYAFAAWPNAAVGSLRSPITTVTSGGPFSKHLGCSLDEITDLLTLWGGDSCEPVQSRLHDLLTERIKTAQRQTAELSSFTSHLESAAHQLQGPAPCT